MTTASEVTFLINAVRTFGSDMYIPQSAIAE